ncbi:MAG TPA: VCBS repeat-containing protein, partial [Flavisolibacter sp.]|nr:VCBS repeat-containing protein [Flavisolibacter sp.]
MPVKGLLAFCLIPVLLFSFSCNRKDTLFTRLSPGETNIHFTNTLEKKKLFNLLYYLYYYNGGGVATGDINNDGLPDIYFTANSKGNNKLYLNKGNFKFEDITDKAGVAGTSDWCTGVTMADVNGDGQLDIYVSAVANHHGLQGHNELFINNGNGRFTESAAQYGLNFSGFTSQAAFFDYDHDGDLDCYLVNQSHKPNENIVDTANRRKFDANAGDRLYRNEMSSGQQKFTDVSAPAGIYQSDLGYGLGLAIADLNNDGWDDIYVGNDFHENDYYYVNNGNGTFTESGAKHFAHYSRFSMGNDVGDYNNDGQLDLVTVDMLPQDEKVLKTYGSDENPDIYKFKILKNGYQYQYSKNCLQRNNGNGSTFSETALLSGVSATDWSWSPLFADLDNDGAKDLLVTSGIVKRPVDLDYIKFVSNLYMHKALNTSDKYDDEALSKMPDGSSHPYLYKGDGQLHFTDVSEDWGTGSMKGYFNGASYADLDNDGNLDLIMNCIDAPAVILKNIAPKKNQLTLSFKGEGNNTSGIGAKAYVFTKGHLQYQELMLTHGFQSSSEPRLHFGLNADSLVDSLVIVWPDQRMQTIRNVPANKPLTLEQKNASGHFNYTAWFPSPAPLLTPDSTMATSWQHHENDFFDYNVQYLIPHGESTRGPKLAVADVNGDGLDDYYACGANQQAGVLMLQRANGSFVASDTSLFTPDAGSEDVDALFFDANGDKAPDLYVVSGGNEYNGENPALLDRLYLNDGKGHFSKAPDALPKLYVNKSCVAAADVDHDGDLDLFTGTLADAKAYGIPQTSYLLLNDGKGHFTKAGQDKMTTQSLGMVTASVFADVNRDGWPDLIVAGEWMPLTVFLNDKGSFHKTALAGSSGWWQSLYVEDVNKDGYPDILAGNWGWNNKFRGVKDEPVKLYVSDFDKNGSMDQLMSYTRSGEEYPFLAKDEMERALPVLKKHYLLYAEYAGLPMKDAFYGFVETVKPLQADRLGSVLCLGDGKGGFQLQDLPAGLQLSPLMSFQKLGAAADQNQYIAGGNFFDITPYEGKYDAQALTVFTVNKQGAVSVLSQPQLEQVNTEIRDLKWLGTGTGK